MRMISHQQAVCLWANLGVELRGLPMALVHRLMPAAAATQRPAKRRSHVLLLCALLLWLSSMLELPQHQPPVLFVLAATTGSKHEPSRPLSPLPSAKAGPNSPTSSRDNFSRSRKSENSTSYDARNPETTELFSVAADRSRSVNSTKSRQLFGVSHGREGSIYRSEQQKPLEGSTVPPQLAADSSASIRRPSV